MELETLCVQGTRRETDITGAVTIPIYQTATFSHPRVGESTGYDYTRTQNPTRDYLEELLGEMDHGQKASAFSTGMAAITAVMELFVPGDHLIISDDLYGGSYRLFHTINKKNGITFTETDLRIPEKIEEKITPSTRAIFLETPSNPMMHVIDIHAVSDIAAKYGLLVIVDNTFLTPYLLKPLDIGADIVVYSGTKYLCGHNDTLAGFVVTRSADINKQIHTILNTTGACLSPLDSWLMIRGLKTLPIRLKQQTQNALRILEWLKGQEQIQKCYYAAGAMISFEVDNKETAVRMLEHVKLVRYAESLGGTETLITYPTLQTHADIPLSKREALGINERLLRLSAGTENVDDLIADLSQALAGEESYYSDFDSIIDRRHTNSLKYDFSKERGRSEKLLPLWVADMDFRAPKEVTEAIEALGKHGVFGYSESGKNYVDAVCGWMKRQYSWNAKAEWIVKTPGVVFAIACAVRGLAKEGEGVLIQQPVYYPFEETIVNNDRKLVVNPLKYIDGHYEIDFEDFEKKISAENVKLFILCSPHNPVGRVWKREELEKLGDICLKYGVYVVSDEIHADFTYEGHRHLVFSDLKPEYSKWTITCTSPGKTFNLAGLQVSNIFIPNVNLRRIIKKEIAKTGYSQLNCAALCACEAAYTHGQPWLTKLKSYLTGNLSVLRDFLTEELPQIKLVEPEGTYLVWLDFRDLGLNCEEQKVLVEEKARLWLDCGTLFGVGGNGFERVNIACPRKILKKALEQLKAAVEAILT